MAMVVTPLGAVLTFKIKRFQLPGVGNRGDSDTKVKVRVGTLTEEIVKCQIPLGVHMGGGLW